VLEFRATFDWSWPPRFTTRVDAAPWAVARFDDQDPLSRACEPHTRTEARSACPHHDGVPMRNRQQDGRWALSRVWVSAHRPSHPSVVAWARGPPPPRQASDAIGSPCFRYSRTSDRGPVAPMDLSMSDNTMARLPVIDHARGMNRFVHPRLARRKLDQLARIASPKAILPTALLTSWALRRHRGAARLVAATAVALIGEEVLKRLVDRHRPKLFDRTAWRSFPSGHSAGATAYLIGTGLAVRRSYRPSVLGIAAVGIAAVNWLRVRARDHWTTDVLAGDLLGLVSVAAAHVAIERVRAPRHETVDRDVNQLPATD
jgi:hypothetical protein